MHLRRIQWRLGDIPRLRIAPQTRHPHNAVFVFRTSRPESRPRFTGPDDPVFAARSGSLEAQANRHLKKVEKALDSRDRLAVFRRTRPPSQTSSDGRRSEGAARHGNNAIAAHYVSRRIRTASAELEAIVTRLMTRETSGATRILSTSLPFLALIVLTVCHCSS